MASPITIAGRRIGPGEKPFVVAEISANHNGRFERSEALVRVAAEIHADAVKLQTYTPDTMTIDSELPWFTIEAGPWAGRTLYELYREAHMPWDWQPKLKKIADECGIPLFSSPFDETAVDFLESLEVPAYKIASFELIDIPLLRKVAATHKPVILSTGLATLDEITEAIETLHNAGSTDVALLKCTSAYPAQPKDMNLPAIPFLKETFGLPVGLSDHSLGEDAALAAVALGACIIEKHLTLHRSDGGPDAGFSLEPDEFRHMADTIHQTALNVAPGLCTGRLDSPTATGHPLFLSETEIKNRLFRRSVFVVADMSKGDVFTRENLRVIRPANGLPPRHYDDVLGRCAAKPIERGAPLTKDLVEP